MHFTTAIFDMDGTLFDTERLALDCWQTAFNDYGVTVLRSDLENVIGVAWQETRDFLSSLVPAGVDFEELVLRARASRKELVAQHGLPLKTGAVELLTLLRERGIKLGLATTTHAERTQENLQRAALQEFFPVIVCGDQVERCKPYPDSYLQALAELKAAPFEAIALEDSDHGIQAAFTAGLRVIHVPDIKQIAAETRNLVHRQYVSLLEFRDVLAV